MTRDEKIANAHQLRKSGKTYPAIAAELGVSKKTVRRWLNPDEADRDRASSRAMKERYRGECEVCAAPTNGCGGPGKASKLCDVCARQRQHDERRWTADAIYGALRQWADEHGRQPHADDWHKAGAYHPSTSTVLREVGSWDQAIRNAGFESHKRQVGIETAAVVRLYVDEELGSYLIADRLGITPSAVLWHLHHAGVEIRSHSESQRLRFDRAS
jgi:DNA-binding CsgD family transcriptional regulator